MHPLPRRTFLAGASTALAIPRIARAASPVKIGVLSDASSAYADLSGTGSLHAAQMAIEDFGGKLLGSPIETVFADHQNKVDVGTGIARQWYDQEGVDLIVDVLNSAIALGLQKIAAEKGRVFMFGATASDLNGKSCSPNGFQWGMDSYVLTHGLANGVVADGGDSWYFISSDYLAGQAAEQEFRKALAERNVPVLGASKFPLNNADFSPFLLAAQASRAKVIAATTGGSDTINLVKQAMEFHIAQGGQKLVLTSYFPTDTHALGLQAAQGIRYTSSFFWDLDDDTRAFTKRYIERAGKIPTWNQADVYSATTHYLRAVAQAGSKDTASVLPAIRQTPVNDLTTRNGAIRDDGQVARDIYFLEVKAPSASSGPWDYESLVATIPPGQAYRPLAQSECPLARHI